MVALAWSLVMTKSWLLSALLALGCGGRMASDDPLQGGGVSLGNGGTSWITTSRLGQGGAPTTTTSYGGATVWAATTTSYGGATVWATTTASSGGSVVWTSAVGGYGTTSPIGAGGATTTTPVGVCTSTTNLVVEASASASGNWIGGDPASTADNPCGVQGAIYAYSDDGLDNTRGTSDDTVQIPAIDPSDSSNRQAPCTLGRCCIAGTTHAWPKIAGGGDYTASVWGGGLGFNLNDPGSGASSRAYAGPVTGFIITTWGHLVGQEIRIAYTQSPYDTNPPFVQFTGIGTYTVPFLSVTCPAWGSPCQWPTPNPYALQVQLVGGDVAGDFQLCVSSITPLF
jgi:hypothetical protein